MKRIVLLTFFLLSFTHFALAQQPATIDTSTTTCPGSGCGIFTTTGQGSIAIQITGSWSGTFTFYGSVDGTNYVTLNVIPTNSSTAVSTTTGNGVWSTSIAGLQFVKVLITTPGTGTATVNARSTLSAKGGGVGGGGGGGGGITSIATTSPITGGTITTTGTIACATCGVTGTGLQQFAATTSAQLAGVISDETGSGPLAFSVSPALTGTPTAPTASTATNSTQLATTAYVTTGIANAIAAVNPAIAVQAATTTILPNSPIYTNGTGGIGATITTLTTNTALVIDGHTMLLGERLLVKNESGGGGLGAADNGVYSVTTIQSTGVAWILTRALDYDQPSDINNTGAIPVVNGTTNATTSWLLTSTVATIGTDPLTFTQFSLNPSTVALTGVDINTSNQVTNVHLTNPVPGNKGGAKVLVEEHTAATVACLAFTTGITGSFDDYQIRFIDLLPDGNDTFNFQVSTNGGSSYLSNIYATAYFRFTKTGNSVNGSAAEQVVNISGGGDLSVSSDATHAGLSGYLDFFNPGSSTWKKLEGQVSYWYSGTPELLGANLSGAVSNTTAVNAFQVCANGAHTFVGTIRLYGIAN